MCHLFEQIHFIQKFLLCFCNFFFFFILTVFILFCFLSLLISDTLTLQPFTGYILVIFRTTLQSATCSCCVQRLRAHRQVCVQWGSVNVLYAVLTVRQKKKNKKNKTIFHSFKEKYITQCTAFKEHHQGENQYSILLRVGPIAGGHWDSFWMIY